MSQIGNANEMSVYFYMPCSYTVDDFGKKSVAIETGYDMCNRYVGGVADGSKLPQYVILNCKTVTKEQLPRGIIIRYQPRGWITSELTKNWYLVVWERRPGGQKDSGCWFWINLRDNTSNKRCNYW